MHRSHARRVALTSSLALLVGGGAPVDVLAHSVAYKPWRASPSMIDPGADTGGFELVPAPAPAAVLPRTTPETPGANGFQLLPQSPTAADASARDERGAAAGSAAAAAGADQVIPAGPPARDVNGFELLPESKAGPVSRTAIAVRAPDAPQLSIVGHVGGFALTGGPPSITLESATQAEEGPSPGPLSAAPLELRAFPSAELTSPRLGPLAANVPSIALDPLEDVAPAVQLASSGLDLRAAAAPVELTAGQGAVLQAGGRAPDLLLAAAPQTPYGGFELLPATPAFGAAEAAAVVQSMDAPVRSGGAGFGQAPSADQAVSEPLPSAAAPGDRSAFAMVGASEAAAPAAQLELFPKPARAVELAPAEALQLAEASPAPLTRTQAAVLAMRASAPNVEIATEPARTVELAPAEALQLAEASPAPLTRTQAAVLAMRASAPDVEIAAEPARTTELAPSAPLQLAAADPVVLGGADTAPAAVSAGSPQLELFPVAAAEAPRPVQLAQASPADTPAPATPSQLQLPPAPSPAPAPTEAAPPPEAAGQSPAGSPSPNQTSATQPGTPITATLGAGEAPATPEAPAAPEAGPAPAPPAPAPIAPARASAVVGRIIVQGNERIEPSTILSYLPIQPGDTVDDARLDLAVKTLIRTDLFSDVSMRMEGSDLIVRVSENPIINQVVFEGNHALKEDKLRDEVTIRPRGIFTRSKVEQDVQRIIELYRRSGRISASVTPKIVQLPQKRVDLIFEIDEGPKSGILHINFIGNKAFSDNALGDVIVTRESHWYKFFQSNDNYDPDRLEYDREQLRKFYRNHGYYDFRIVSAVAELAPDRNGFIVTFTVDEGPKYHFGKLKVDTQLKRLNGELLQALLPIREGQLYEDDRIEKAVDSLTYAAGANGFAFVDVRPRYVAHPETKTVDVTFDIREGPRVYIERIDIVGNTQTLDKVIRREMRVSEGDAYNRVLVDRSKNQIRALGFFKDVDIEQLPGSAPDKTILRVKVTEQPTGQLTFSLGYSSLEKLVGDVGISQSNFRGRGQQVNFQVSLGYLRKQVILSFTEPRFMGRNMSAGFDVYTYRYNFSDQASFQSSSTGLNLKTGFPINQYSTVGLRYSIHSDKVSLPSYVIDPTTGRCIAGYSQSLCDELGTALTSSIGYSVRWDRRNDPILPTRGFYVDFAQDFAGVGGDVQYVKSEVDGAWYYGFTPSWILSFQGSGGYITGWGGDSVRINDRFFRGGESFRGFEIAGIGPRDVSLVSTSGAPIGDALGGKLYGIGTVELSVPTPIPQQYGIKTALFTDFGTLGLLDDRVKRNPDGTIDPNIKDNLAFRASAGITVKWKSPMGPLQFDFSKVLKKAPYDRTETFRFSTATRF